ARRRAAYAAGAVGAQVPGDLVGRRLAAGDPLGTPAHAAARLPRPAAEEGGAAVGLLPGGTGDALRQSLDRVCAHQARERECGAHPGPAALSAVFGECDRERLRSRGRADATAPA